MPGYPAVTQLKELAFLLRVLLVLAFAVPQFADNVSEISAVLRRGEYAHALELAKQALQRAPHNANLWTLAGIAAEGLHDTAKAIDAYNHALAESPDLLPALKGKGGIQYRTGDAGAQRTLEHILQQQPEDEIAHAMLGSLHYRSRLYAEARMNFERAQGAIAREPTALTEYAECLLQSHENEKAIRVLRLASALKAPDWSGSYNVALAELVTGEPAAALADLQPLLAGERSRTEVLELASSAYEAQGDTPKAVATLRAAIVQDPRNVDLYLHFVDLCFAHRSFQAGVEMVSAGIVQLPAAARLYVARGILYAQLGKYDDANADFHKAESLDPEQSFGSLAEGVEQLQNANFDQTLAITEEQIRKTPNDAFLYYLKAEALRSRGGEASAGDLQGALNAAQQAVRLRPNFPLAEDLLGNLYRKQGHDDLARRQFESAIRHDPANESAVYHLMMLERSAGNEQRAHELLKQLGAAKETAKANAVKADRYRLVVPDSPQQVASPH